MLSVGTISRVVNNYVICAQDGKQFLLSDDLLLNRDEEYP